MDKFLQLTLTGLTNGAIFALVALGFVLIYKASDVINFAQGDFLLVGAYLTFGLISQVGLPWSVGMLIAIVVAVLLGIVVERLVLRPLIGEPIISVIMVTIGLSSLLRSVVIWIWGTMGAQFPSFLPSQPINVFGAVVPADRFIAIGLAAVLLVVFTLFFRYSREGIAMRATADDQQAALSMGISVQKIFAIAWSIAAVTAVLAGIIVANITELSFFAVSSIGLHVFPVVILGGLDSIPGAIIGGLIIGLLESYVGGYTPSALALRTVFPFIVLIIILMIKPYGLFGEERIERV
ncbi:MAG: branched-chain amino acid ABC transporter permease [Ardenticatenaceae bacterium]|nr:branched-chain amino acid ABC transporter permease [Anaerolineales bacterium]MCB8923578.1 branched-chain amino acid ABC transporter permease [Ardenticatenaceae bacterium]MCB9003518.1 branched-chain amino acid ABC transporter permease [Ardenticatenaceae bacterium]